MAGLTYLTCGFSTVSTVADNSTNSTYTMLAGLCELATPQSSFLYLWSWFSAVLCCAAAVASTAEQRAGAYHWPAKHPESTTVNGRIPHVFHQGETFFFFRQSSRLHYLGAHAKHTPRTRQPWFSRETTTP